MTYSELSIESRRTIQPKEGDLMITKACVSCDADVMLRIDEKLCMNCKEVKGIV